MKKLIALLLAVVMLLAFAACSKGSTEEDTTTAADTTAESTSNVEDLTEGRENLFETEPVTNEDGDVVITCPASFYDEYNPPSEELTDEQKTQGFKKAIVNEDGSLSYIIDAAQFESLKQQNAEDTRATLSQYSTAHDYIKQVAASEDFSVINLQVDPEGFSADMSGFAIIWEIGLYGQLAQVMAGVTPDKLDVNVILTDAETGEVINGSHYPMENDNP